MTSNATTILNSQVETGLRTLVVLEALFPRRCSLTELVWFDYVVVNTGLFNNAPASLHPDTEVATGELLVRRHVVQAGISMLRLLHLADEWCSDDGFTYASSDEAPLILDRLNTQYHLDLKDRAAWLARRFGQMTNDEIEQSIDQAVGRWTAHLLTEEFPTGVQI